MIRLHIRFKTIVNKNPQFIVTNQITVVNSGDGCQLCTQDWPNIPQSGGTSQPTPLHKKEDAGLASDFKY